MTSVIESFTKTSKSISENWHINTCSLCRSFFGFRFLLLCFSWWRRCPLLAKEILFLSNLNNFLYELCLWNQSIGIFVHFFIGLFEWFGIIAILHDSLNKILALSPIEHVILVHIKSLECLNDFISKIGFSYNLWHFKINISNWIQPFKRWNSLNMVKLNHFKVMSAMSCFTVSAQWVVAFRCVELSFLDLFLIDSFEAPSARLIQAFKFCLFC